MKIKQKKITQIIICKCVDIQNTQNEGLCKLYVNYSNINIV